MCRLSKHQITHFKAYSGSVDFHYLVIKLFFVFQSIIMCCLTLLAAFIVAYTILYLTALLFVDCDLWLAWAEKFGKPVGKFEEKYIVIT